MRRIPAALLTKLPRAAAVLGLLYFALCVLGPAIRYNVVPKRHPVLLAGNDAGSMSTESSSITVNLVVASRARDNIDWTAALSARNFEILRYVNDDPAAQYRPPVPKGREALMYLTYVHDFYDSLPDITIFVHADETPWHVEGTLLQNTSFALSNLDLNEVLKRGYFNLRATWRAGCPSWINTTKSLDDWDQMEEPYMKEAWAANFGLDQTIPDELGGPCCSQFAVTKKTIHRRSREQYELSRNWLAGSTWSDSILGRVWEHMWPWLFTGNASDCAHLERPSLCQMYGVCFTSDGELEEYKELWEERERLKEKLSFFQALWSPRQAAEAWNAMGHLVQAIEEQMSTAWKQGKDPTIKARVLAMR